MKNEDIYIWLESNNVPKKMYREINDVVWPVYNGTTSKGDNKIQSLDKPEERVRIKIISEIENTKELYTPEQRTQNKGTQQIDIFLPRINMAFEVKNEDVFDNPKYVEELKDYLPFCSNTLLITYSEKTKRYITKDINGEKKYYTKMEEIIHGTSLIKEDDLIKITNDAVPTIINNMLEILYSNNVSDYSKGLDVIVKLIACKNIDENQINSDNIMKLQVNENESDNFFMEKIVDLYLKSAKELNNKVDEQFMCTQAIFYIIEVDDEFTYKKNIKILKELIKEIQMYKFVKVGCVDFITKLFEELENNKTLKDYGIYITDSNITDFITKSLPISDYIQQTGNPMLRYQDPAVGTGHFPNSFINEMSSTIEKLNKIKFKPQNIEGKEFIEDFNNSNSVKRNYISNYISGIDVQKRNIELCRINTTLKNGDPIKCYHGNSLQKDFLRKKYPNSMDFKDGGIDVITSNYPFSVKGFIKDIDKDDCKLYDLSQYCTDKAQQIENIFLEDTIQKLKEGGLAGFIIFESVLWKIMGINNSLRHKLLVECELISVVKFGSEAFKNTSTKSVAIFLRKRKKEEVNDNDGLVNNFFKNYQEITFEGDNIIDMFAQEIYGITFSKYVEYVIGLGNKSKESKKLINKEKEKILLYLSNYKNKILYVDLSFEFLNNNKLTKKQNQELRKKKQREILGVSKSSYDEKKYENSSYLPILSDKIKTFFNDKDCSKIELSDLEKVYDICDVVNFEDDGGFAISFDGNSNEYLSETYVNSEFITLGEIVQFHEKTKNRADDGIIGGKYPFYTCTSDDDAYKTTNYPDRNGEFLLINNGGESFVRLTEENSEWSASGDIIIMSSKDQTMSSKFIFKFLKNNPKVLEWTYKGSGLKHSSIGRLKKIMIPKMTESEINVYLNNKK
jgi:type I restriction-modification system DNA methylase subunit